MSDETIAVVVTDADSGTSQVSSDSPINITQTGNQGADGKQIELQKGATYIQWRYTDDTEWTNLVALADLVGAQGDEVEMQVTAEYIQWRIAGGEWANLLALSSIKGDKGDKGDTGAKGDTGVGIQGAQGIQGIQGARGEKGDTGATGSQGAQGIKGDKGDVGEKGDKGDTGDTGLQGERGFTGATGAQGATGATGAKGDKGDKGDTGATGAGVIEEGGTTGQFLKKKSNDDYDVEWGGETDPLSLHLNGDNVRLFDGSVTRDANGLIETITRTGGLTFTITRDEDGYISSMTDGTHTWTFTRTNGYITSWSVE